MDFCRFFLLAGTISLLGCAEPGTVAMAYNPGLIVYEPEDRVFEDCGNLSLGLDPRWEFEAEFEPDGRNGTPRWEFDSRYTADISARLNPSPLAPYTSKPIVSIWLYCETEPSPPNEAKRVADLFHSRSVADPTQSEVERSSLDSESGVWEAVTFKKTTEKGNISRTLRLYQQRDGRLVTLAFYSNEFNKAEFGGFVSGHEVYTLTTADGEEIQHRLARPMLLAPSGMVVGDRRSSTSKAFFEKALATTKTAERN